MRLSPGSAPIPHRHAHSCRGSLPNICRPPDAETILPGKAAGTTSLRIQSRTDEILGDASLVRAAHLGVADFVFLSPDQFVVKTARRHPCRSGAPNPSKRYEYIHGISDRRRGRREPGSLAQHQIEPWQITFRAAPSSVSGK